MGIYNYPKMSHELFYNCIPSHHADIIYDKFVVKFVINLCKNIIDVNCLPAHIISHSNYP